MIFTRSFVSLMIIACHCQMLVAQQADANREGLMQILSERKERTKTFHAKIEGTIRYSVDAYPETQMKNMAHKIKALDKPTTIPAQFEYNLDFKSKKASVVLDQQMLHLETAKFYPVVRELLFDSQGTYLHIKNVDSAKLRLPHWTYGDADKFGKMFFRPELLPVLLEVGIVHNDQSIARLMNGQEPLDFETDETDLAIRASLHEQASIQLKDFNPAGLPKNIIYESGGKPLYTFEIQYSEDGSQVKSWTGRRLRRGPYGEVDFSFDLVDASVNEPLEEQVFTAIAKTGERVSNGYATHEVESDTSLQSLVQPTAKNDHTRLGFAFVLAIVCTAGLLFLGRKLQSSPAAS